MEAVKYAIWQAFSWSNCGQHTEKFFFWLSGALVLLALNKKLSHLSILHVQDNTNLTIVYPELQRTLTVTCLANCFLNSIKVLSFKISSYSI